MWKAEEQAWLAPYYRSCKHLRRATTRAANVPRSTTSARFSPPSSIRIIADWKNKLRRGSRQFEETGRLLLNHRLSGPFDYHLLAGGYVIVPCQRGESMDGLPLCSRRGGGVRVRLHGKALPQIIQHRRNVWAFPGGTTVRNITFSHHLCIQYEHYLSYDTLER